MPFLDEDHFLLGSFGSNCSSGMAVTKIPERWDNSWENNLKLAQMLEEAGIEFMLPVARWIGHGGETNFQGNSLESLTWATGLLALTRKLHVVATVHSTANHPVVVAKQMATIDQISHSRIALNIVAGWNKPEYDALGLDLPATHEQRYGYAQEWCEIVRALWARTTAFNWDGKFWKLKNVLGKPRPTVPPTILNAAGSGEGREFAVRNADVLFTVTFDPQKSKTEIAELKAKAAEVGRSVEVLTTCYIVCRPTEQEAQDYLKYYVDDNADWEGADKLMTGLLTHSKTFPDAVQAKIRKEMAAGHGSYKLVGTPRQVADGIIELHSVGFRGTTLSFVDFIKEFPYFRDEVLPLLEQAGIRKPCVKNGAKRSVIDGSEEPESNVKRPHHE